MNNSIVVLSVTILLFSLLRRSKPIHLSPFFWEFVWILLAILPFVPPLRPLNIRTSFSPSSFMLRFFTGKTINLLHSIGAVGFCVFVGIHLQHLFSLYKATIPADSQEIRKWLIMHPTIRSIRFRISSDFSSPFTYGIFFPTIVLPKSYSRCALPCLLTHEWTHVRRFDVLKKFLVLFSAFWNWYQPCMWLLPFALTRELELCCDACVIRNMSIQEKAYYAELLLVNHPAPNLSFGFSFSSGELKERVTSIMKPSKFSIPTTVFFAALLCFLVFFTACTSRSIDVPNVKNQPLNIAQQQLLQDGFGIGKEVK